MLRFLFVIYMLLLLWTDYALAVDSTLTYPLPQISPRLETASLMLLDPATVNTLVARIQRQYEEQNAFTTNFNQILVNNSSRETEQRSGTFAFLKPHLVRWETFKPEKELLVVSDHEVWEFFPAEGTAYCYPLEDIFQSKTMLRFITGNARLDQDFHVKGYRDNAGSPITLDLVPRKPEPGLVQAYAWVDPVTALFNRIVLQDFYGNVNDLTFQNLTSVAKLDKSLFLFIPPKGTQIFNNINIFRQQ